MKTRIYKNIDGSVIYSTPAQMFQGGTFIDELSKPIYSDADDLTKPAMIEVNGNNEESGKYEQKKIISGYEKRELTFDDCRFPEEFIDLDFIDVDESNIPVSNSNTGDYHEMLYFDGDCKLENLKQDKSWETVLMPSFLIVKKHIKHLDKSLDAELAKDSPDPIAAIKLSQKKEAAKKLDPITNEKELLEIALEGLGRASVEKPIIKAKLEEKIKDLT